MASRGTRTWNALSNRVVITNAQMLSLVANPVDIVSPPGEGKYILPCVATIELDWAANYTNIDAAATLTIEDLNGNGLLSFLDEAEAASKVSFLLAGGEPRLAVLAPYQPSNGAYNEAFPAWRPVDLNNQGLRLRLRNGGAELTGGNAANRVVVTYCYHVGTLASI